MSNVAKTNELHAFLRKNLPAPGCRSEAFNRISACLLAEQAVLALLAEVTGEAISSAETLIGFAQSHREHDKNGLVERICRELYQSGHWLNDLRLARQYLLHATPAAADKKNAMLISVSEPGSIDPVVYWINGFEQLLAEVREFNTEY